MPKTKTRLMTRVPAPDPAPVQVRVQPVTRCAECGHPVTYPREAGAASAALTAHRIRAGHGTPAG